MTPARAAAVALAAALRSESDVVVHDHVPEDLEAPCVAIQPSDRYLVGNGTDVTFADSWDLTLEVWVLVDVHTNQQATDELDDALEHVLNRLPDEWGIDAVNRPGPVVTAEWSGHGCRVTVSRHITL